MLPCIAEAAQMLKAAGIREAVIPAELYACEDSGRTRVFDVLAALADSSRYGELRLAVFDIISLADARGTSFTPHGYGDTYKKLREIFSGGRCCAPVLFTSASSKTELKETFNTWVTDQGSEGIVVRSDLPMVYKIKPRLSIDAAVIGFSEGSGESAGQVRTLLYALMTEDGRYQVIGRTGNGLSAEQKHELYPVLLEREIKSNYIETDSNHVAFRLIRPGLVMELSVNDVLFENSSGAVINPLLELNSNFWRRSGTIPGFSFVSPVFERFREDKGINPQDLRISQVYDHIAPPQAQSLSEANRAGGSLPRSVMLRREVYRKKLMVQKFLVWRTNKEEYGYPGYVLSLTNFSSERNEILTTEMRISSDEKQIMELCDDFIAKNIKKEWDPVT
jgi:ATP-dependent DNA ligase